MNNRLKVSIVTPSFNQGQFIEETILSVIGQTYKNIQYIIVDGGSTDCTMNVVEKYRDRVDIVIHEKDKGQSDAINKGFKLAKGELIGWINSDDTLYPDCIERIVNAYSKNSTGSIYYGQTINQIDKDSRVINAKSHLVKSRKYLLNQNFDVVQPGSFYSKLILSEINYLDSSIHYCMDLDLWIRLLEHGKIFAVEGHPLATIRKWEGTKTSTGEKEFLIEIKKVILCHGAKMVSRNIAYINFRIFVNKVKDFFYR